MRFFGWLPCAALLGIASCASAAAPAPVAAAQRGAPAAGAPAPAAAPAAREQAGLYERVAVLGASLSDGSGLSRWTGFPCTLAPLLGALLREHGALASHSDVRFFARPHELGAGLAEAARAGRPTLVFAYDFLFWYAHGAMPEDQRMAGLERGLGELERFDCPLVIADLPDVHIALGGQMTRMGGGPLVTPEMLPEPETLARLNERLRAWARARGDVVVVPLARFHAEVSAGRAFRVGGAEWPAGSTGELLQSDLLHPTLEGVLALFAITAEALAAEGQPFAAGELRGELAELRAAWPAALSDARAAWEAEQAAEAARRAAGREERRKARERG